MALPDALKKQFQPFFIFSSDVRMMSACHPALYAPEEHVISTCWIEGIYSGPSIVERFDARKNWNSKGNSRKILFETRKEIRKSNHERGNAQYRAAHATVSQQIRTRLV